MNSSSAAFPSRVSALDSRRMQRRRRRGLLAAFVVVLLLVLLLIWCGREDRIVCATNLSELGRTLLSMSNDERRETKKLRGAAMFLSWRRAGRIDEGLLRCPFDPDLRPLDDAARRAYDTVDLSHPPDDLCSYAVRDFERYPLPSAGSSGKEIIACCRDGRTPHHRGRGVIVLWSDGDVQWMPPQQLGLAPEDPVVVGPGSKSEVLKKVIQIPAR